MPGDDAVLAHIEMKPTWHSGCIQEGLDRTVAYAYGTERMCETISPLLQYEMPFCYGWDVQ